VEPFGSFILHPSPDIYLPSTDIDVNIVAVHGLNGSARKTWTDSATGQCWLEDLLPESIPRCRVLTFGYDSKLAFSKSRSGVEAFARDLLNRLRIVRSSSEARNRPLVFIAHSLGGIMVKKVVPEYSAIMGLPNETVLPINAHHRGLTRFSRKTNQNYILVEAAIREVAYGSMDKCDPCPEATI
ncbi:hypothetical protein FOXYSP1_15502, partial [Fusarium oxysporum f. sp. phaseoli]